MSHLILTKIVGTPRKPSKVSDINGVVGSPMSACLGMDNQLAPCK